MRRSMIHVVCFTLGALLAAPAIAAPAKKAAKAAKPSEALTKLEDEAKDLQKQVDDQLLSLFRYQVQSGVYRSRLATLQKEWQKLFANMQVAGTKRKIKMYPTPKPADFVIDEAVGSDAESLESAVSTSSCKKKAGCRIWARISFGKEMVQKGGKYEFSAELKLKSGTTRVAVPTKEMTITGPVATVELALDALYIYKGTYEGTLKVMCGERYKSKRFSFELIETY
jgi:hypothetical protein